MPGVIARIFRAHYPSACVVGVLAGLAIAVPAGSSDWASSFVYPRGFATVDADLTRNGSGVPNFAYAIGPDVLQASFERDYGDLVLGGSYQQGRSDADSLGAAQEISREFRLRAGYDFGRMLGYLTVGEQQNGTGVNEARNQVYGIGLRVSVNRALQMAGEIVHHVSGSPVPGQGTDEGVFSIQAAFRF